MSQTGKYIGTFRKNQRLYRDACGKCAEGYWAETDRFARRFTRDLPILRWVAFTPAQRAFNQEWAERWQLTKDRAFFAALGIDPDTIPKLRWPEEQ